MVNPSMIYTPLMRLGQQQRRFLYSGCSFCARLGGVGLQHANVMGILPAPEYDC